MSAKQKILHGNGPSNLNLGIFDICRASSKQEINNIQLKLSTKLTLKQQRNNNKRKNRMTIDLFCSFLRLHDSVDVCSRYH